MPTNSKCFLCGNATTNLQLRTTASDAQLLQDWKRHWATSLCEILGMDQESYKSVFQSASYCACCQESICTVDFALRTIARFESNLTSLRSDIMERLNHHYAKINPEDHDPLGVTDSPSLEIVINAIQNVKLESDDDGVSCGDEFYDAHFSDHHYVRQQRLLKLMRRLPLVHIHVSSSSRKKNKQNLTGSSHAETVVVQSPPPDTSEEISSPTIRIAYPNDNEKTCSPSKVSRSGRVIKPVRRLHEISDNDNEGLSDVPESGYAQGHELLAPDDEPYTPFIGPELSLKEKGRKRRVTLQTSKRERNVKKKRIVEITDDDDTAAKFPCPVCKKAFPSESKMGVHLNGAHRVKESNSFKCSICFKLFNSADKCQDHERLHQENTPFTCIFCQRTLTNAVELIHHVQMEHDYKITWCNLAQCLQAHVAFTNQKEMKIHLVTHHQMEGNELELLHHCTRCELRFKTRKTLGSHLIKAHQILEGDALPCPICSKAFVGTKRLKAHQENVHTAIERNPKCSICRKSFLTTQSASEHELLHCSSSRGPFDCVLCEEKAKNTMELHKHVMRTHEILPFKCLEPDCDELGFETESKLKQHQDRRHYPIEEAKCCDKCPFKTRKLHLLQAHMLTHGERKFPCIVKSCSARFHSEHNRDAHFHYKHETNSKRLFRCKLCPKTFRARCMLSDHETYHTDLRPFLCEICSATFKTTNTLQHHMRVHDPNKKTRNNWKLQRPRKARLSKPEVAKGMTVVETEDLNVDGAQKLTETQVCPPIGEINTGKDGHGQRGQRGEKVVALHSFPEVPSYLPNDWF